MEKLKDYWEKAKLFISTTEFLVGLVLGFTLGAMHAFYGL